MKRRDFILTETAAGAAALVSAHGAGAGSDSTVVDRLSGYSSRVAMDTSGGEVRIVASIDDINAFIDPKVQARALPYDPIRAEGNTLSFRHRGVRYKLENVFPEQFDRCTGGMKPVLTGLLS